MTLKKILLCTDGEEHTHRAEDYAIDLAEKFGAEIICLYVVSPFLKRYTNEIYAVNRDECREHLDKSLQKEGEDALKKIMKKATGKNIVLFTKIRYGYPLEEILAEIDEGDYDILIMGSKLLNGWKKRFESFSLPEKIFKKSPISMVFVR